MLLRTLVASLALLAACAPTSTTLRGTVELPEAARGSSGRLVVWWEGRDERAQRGLDWPLFLDILDRARVVAAGEMTEASVPYELPRPPGDTIVHAVLDLRGAFFDTLLGGGDGNFAGQAGAAAGAVALEARTVPEPEEYCEGARFGLLHIEAPFVAGRLGNETRRRLCIWLPAGYDEPAAASRRYPVVYALPGLGSTDRARMAGRGSLPEAAEALGAEIVLVGVDTSTVTGSTYFVDSAASGEWMRFVDTMVTTVDAHVRTIAEPAARAIIGQSTGGYSAVSLAMRRPDLFGAAAASAPDGLDLAAWLLDASGERLAPRWLSWLRFEAAMAAPDHRQAGQFLSYAADWSPSEPGAAAPFEWPVDLETGRLRPEVWAWWWALSPAALLKDPDTLERVRATLDGRLFLAVGRHDEFDLLPPTEAFSERLRAADIEHTLVVGEGGHGRGQAERLRAGLAFLLERLPTPE